MAADYFANLPRELAETLQQKQELAKIYNGQLQCKACARSGGGAVPSKSGSVRPYLAVVLPAPTAFEKACQEALAGRGGHLLLDLIEEHVGLQRSQVFVTFAAACYSALPPTAEEVATCQSEHRAMRYSGALVIWHMCAESAQSSTSQPWPEIVGKAHRRGLRYDVYLPDPRDAWRISENRARIIDDLEFIGDLVRMPFLIDAWRVFAGGQQWSADSLDQVMGELENETQKKHKSRFLTKVLKAMALGPAQGSLS